MKPLPWSFTHWDEFSACPRLFHAKRVEKSIKEPPSPEQAHGIRLHEAFEHRQKSGKPLPVDIADHEPYMQSLEGMGGKRFTEYEACLNIQLKPCAFFAKDVWLRQKIDFKLITTSGRMAHIVDYKTGNPAYPKYEQLILNALQIFVEHPTIDGVTAEFYWTKIHDTSKKQLYLRSQQAELWGKFTPTLKQMREAYETNTWQPRQNFRCYGFCPLTDCEFWREKKKK